MLRNSGGIWVDVGGTLSAAANTITKNGVSQFSVWSLGNSVPTAVTVDHVGASTNAAMTDGVLPTASKIVALAVAAALVGAG
ncbi:MAG: hypothetical protein LC737_09250, partial [Chloroflexi bacterium]|nr:hypothetical protein [Chloroflexota bacterium]